jgi:hypothetical protein
MHAFTKFNTKPILCRLIKAGGEYYPLAETQNAFSGYDWVRVNVWWDSVDVGGGLIAMMERGSSRVPVWDQVIGQTVAITAGSGSATFNDYDLSNQEVSININPATAVAGNFYYEVYARKQYGMEEVVVALGKIDSSLDKFCSAINNLGARIK